MEFYETIRKRRMVRNYQVRPVDPAAVERIVNAGIRAPSAGFSQGQSFVIVTDPDRRKQIALAAGEDSYIKRGFDPWISRAPVHIAIVVSPDAYLERYHEPDKGNGTEQISAWPVPYWWVDGGASLMAILLASIAEGLSAGFLGAHSIPTLADVLQLPERSLPLGVVTIGYPLPDRVSSSVQRGRKDLQSVVYREVWGGTHEARAD